jgi:peptidoglycan/xylan/chitin deacetylase (PgdA/CDA1 family)
MTFDDGPSNYTDDLLDLLAKYNAKATFFITGINNGKGEIDDTSLIWPSVIKRQYADGHQIASHTWSHANLDNITSTERKNEMIKNEMALRNILGFIPTYMRPPYSACSEATGCEADMVDLGYHIVYFDLDTQDYLHDSTTLIQESKDIVEEFFAGKSAATFDALAIGHDIHFQTVYNLTEYLIQTVQAQNYSLVSVGTCLGDPVENWYRSDPSATVASVSVSSTSTSAISTVAAATSTTSSSSSSSAVVVSSSITTTAAAASSSSSAISHTSTLTTLVSSSSTTIKQTSTTSTASAATPTSTGKSSAATGESHDCSTIVLSVPCHFHCSFVSLRSWNTR